MGGSVRSVALVALLLAPTALAGTSTWDANWYTLFDMSLDATSLPACNVFPPQAITPHVAFVQKYSGNSRLTGYRNTTKGFETNFTTAVGVLRTFDMSLVRPCTPGAYRIAAYITTSQVPPTPGINKGSSYVDLFVVGTPTAPVLVEAANGSWTADSLADLVVVGIERPLRHDRAVRTRAHMDGAIPRDKPELHDDPPRGRARIRGPRAEQRRRVRSVERQRGRTH